jgi:hypothetical protein
MLPGQMHVLRQVDCGVEQNMSLYNQKGAKGGFLYLELSSLPLRIYNRETAPGAEMHQTRNAEDILNPYQSQDVDNP